ncbi:MAG: hypothetical protein C0615_01085 [Desulfuromonas sp.]|nr:MAG: hypothetical protein C0615_01085 [Desulfuromonas sp.]
MEEKANIDDFTIASLDDEIKVDKLCVEFLGAFYKHLLDERGLEPLDAGSRARGADYFLRDFIIADRRENIFQITPERVRQFGGNWYILSNMEPNLAELGDILAGVAAFYEFCAGLNLIDRAANSEIGAHCLATDYYTERIEAFHDISGDGFIAWNDACPVT